MSSARHNLRVAQQLQAIECARRDAAEAVLAEARREVAGAKQKQNDAERDVGEAEQAWALQLAGGRLDPALSQLFAGALLSREAALSEAATQTSEAEALSERRLGDWIHLEASVRSGDRLLTRWRRDARRKRDEARDRELADRTSRKWFDR